MIKMDYEKLNNLDLWHTAIHECSHTHVARHYGLGAVPAVWRNPTSDPMNFKYWLGNTHLDGAINTTQRRRRIGIAGQVGEIIYRSGSPSDCDEIDISCNIYESFGEDFESSDGWSESDWNMAQTWTDHDVRAVYSILKRNWMILLKEAEYLVSLAIKHGVAYLHPNDVNQIA